MLVRVGRSPASLWSNPWQLRRVQPRPHPPLPPLPQLCQPPITWRRTTQVTSLPSVHTCTVQLQHVWKHLRYFNQTSPTSGYTSTSPLNKPPWRPPLVCEQHHASAASSSASPAASPAALSDSDSSSRAQTEVVTLAFSDHHRCIVYICRPQVSSSTLTGSFFFLNYSLNFSQKVLQCSQAPPPPHIELHLSLKSLKPFSAPRTFEQTQSSNMHHPRPSEGRLQYLE